MKKNAIKITSVLLMVLCCNFSFANYTPPQPLGPVPPGYPIDGGIVVLFILSFALGLYKLKNIKKASK